MAIHYGGGGSGGSGISPSDKYLVGDALTDGSIRITAHEDKFKVQKRVDGVWVSLITSDVDQTLVSESVMTGVGSLHLGAIHSIGSAGENVILKNEETGVNWFPVWQGVSTDGVTVVQPASRIYQAKIASQPVGATAASSGQIDYSFQTTFASNTSVFGVKIVSAETYTGKARWVASYTDGKEISSFTFDVNCIPGDIIDVPFKYPLDARTGAVVNVKITKEDASFFKVRASSSQPTQPWRELTVRVFSDSNVPVDYNTSYEYPAGAKSVWFGINVIANGAIPAGTAFAWGTTGATWKPEPTGPLNFRGVYANSTAYAVNDLVAIGSANIGLYICETAHTSAASSGGPVGTDASSWTQRLYGGASLSAFNAATATTAGRSGAVPKPAIGDNTAVLRGSGAWGAPASDWVQADAYYSGALVRNPLYGRGLFIANSAIPAGTAFSHGATGATWRSLGSHGSAVASTFETDSRRMTMNGATVVTSAPITLGGFLFRIEGAESSVVLQVSRATAGSPTQLYADAIKINGSGLITGTTTLNIESIGTGGTYVNAASAPFNITGSYERLSFEFSIRNTENSRWSITVQRNGNNGAFLTGLYWGDIRANS
jgi:hypothetical protein